jgi:hypothetical protein
LRLDANLFKPACGRKRDQRGQPPLQGRTLPKLSVVLNNSKTIWTTVAVSQWYGDLGLFSLIMIRADELAQAPGGLLRSHPAAWCRKKNPTFSDAIAAVRRIL